MKKDPFFSIFACIFSNMQLGIYNETHPLKSAVVWGPLGAEALLAQFYPPEISLFLDNMNVIKAREEALSYIDSLKSFGVEIHIARDILAENIQLPSVSFNTALSALIQKADDIREQYNLINHKNYKEILEYLLKLDVERYGANKACVLNWKLSLYPFLPLGNLIYARDQMNVLLSKRVSSAMKKDIRKPEVELYEIVYRQLFNSDNSIRLPIDETFEGGDAYIHDKTIYIGVGSRTSIGAAISIFENLESEIDKHNYKFALVVDEIALTRPFIDQMNFMHLDTFSNPIGTKQIAVCLKEAKLRKIKLLKRVGSRIKIIETKKTFLDYLFEDGQEIVSIPEEEQESFGCNFLSINNKDILVPLKTNKKTLEGLAQVGKKIHYAHLDESTKGFGAAHCMTGQLLRA